jgi:hypothetical protein
MLRWALMPMYANNDMLIISRESHYISLENSNIYRFFLDNFPTHIHNGDIAYPPPIYYSLALWEKALSSLGLIDISSWVSNYIRLPFFNRTVFLLKLPYLFLDVASAILLMKTMGGKKGEYAFALWMMNPVITSKGSLEEGGLDRYKALSVLDQGFAACFKNMPLLLLPIFA